MTTTIPGTDLVPTASPTSPSAQPSPFFRGPQVSRRAMLGGLLGLGLATFLDASPLSMLTAEAAPRTKKPALQAAAGGQFAQAAPYAVTASSELSDDVFATSAVLLGEDDMLLPFYNPFSKVDEALVLSGTSLSHLRRDPTGASGWSYVAFDLQGVLTSVTGVALAANNDHVYALLVGDPDEDNNEAGSPYWLTGLDDAVTWNAGFIAPTDNESWPPDPGPMKGGISKEGTPYFYSATVSGSTWSLHSWVVVGDFTNPLQYRPLLDLDISADAGGPIQDFTLLYDTSDGSDTVGYALVLRTGGDLMVYPQQGQTISTMVLTDAGTTGVSELMWAWASPNSTSGTPGYAVQANIPGAGGEGTYFCDENGNFDKLADLPGTGTSVVSVWLLDDLYTVNLLDSNGVLHTIQQTAPGQWAAPLPITNGVPGSPTPGLAAIYGVPTDPTRSTLFAIGADETLSALSLDPSGWTQTQIHQDDVVAVQLTCYRLTVNVVDNFGTPVTYGQAQLGTDRPVGLWQDIGSTILVPSTPVTMNGDINGQIIVSVPAEELDTAQLTVQAVNPDGSLSAAQTVIADYDVRNFLGGTAALNDLGTLSGATLLAAKNPDGSPLVPGLTSDSAGYVSTLVNQAIVAGNGAAPAAAAVRAMRLQLSGKTAHKKAKLSTSRNPHAYRSLQTSSLLGSSISHVFDSIGHALRHGLAVIDNTSIYLDDAKNWLVDLELTIAGKVVSYTQLAITDMKDAFHVIGGLFATLGADIVAAVTWLKREVGGFLSGVGQNANTIGTLLSDGPASLISIVNGIEKQVDGWFAQQEATVSGWIAELQTAVEAATFGSSQPLGTPSTDTGSATGINGLGKDVKWITKVVNDSPGKWLYDKLMQYLPQTPGPDLTGVFDQVYADLDKAFTDGVELGVDVVHTLWDTMKAYDSPTAMTETTMSAWFADINGVIQQGLTLADDIADAVLDFVKAGLACLGDYLNYAWSLTSISPVLKYVLDKLGYDPTMTLNRLVSLTTAFPLTLVRTLTGKSAVYQVGSAAASAGQQSLSASADSSDSADTSDTGDNFCYTTAAISQFIWTAADVIGDFQLVVKQGEKTREQQPGIIDYFDIICPILETVLLLPGRSGNLIWNGLPTNTKLGELLPPAIYTSLISPILGIALKAAPKTTTNPNVIPYYQDAPAEDSAYAQYYGPVTNCLAGLANTVVASWYGYKNASSTTAAVEAIAGPILGNASYINAPFATYWLNASTEDTPLAVKLIIDGVGGIGAGALYAGQG